MILLKIKPINIFLQNCHHENMKVTLLSKHIIKKYISITTFLSVFPDLFTTLEK